MSKTDKNLGSMDNQVEGLTDRYKACGLETKRRVTKDSLPQNCIITSNKLSVRSAVMCSALTVDIVGFSRECKTVGYGYSRCALMY